MEAPGTSGADTRMGRLLAHCSAKAEGRGSAMLLR